MKSLAELKAIRDKAKENIIMRQENPNNIKVVVGMGTCGIAAGARSVLGAFLEEVKTRSLHNVVITQTGCAGLCKQEPIVEVYVPGQEKVTYIKMSPEKVSKIVSDHLINGKAVGEYSIGAEQQ